MLAKIRKTDKPLLRETIHTETIHLYIRKTGSLGNFGPVLPIFSEINLLKKCPLSPPLPEFGISKHRNRKNETTTPTAKQKRHVNSLSKTRYKDTHTALKLIPTEDGTIFRKVFAKYLLSKKVFSLITY